MRFSIQKSIITSLYNTALTVVGVVIEHPSDFKIPLLLFVHIVGGSADAFHLRNLARFWKHDSNVTTTTIQFIIRCYIEVMSLCIALQSDIRTL